MDDDPGPRPYCDYRHDGEAEPHADWVMIGEAGDCYLCDAHFRQRTEEGQRGWRRVP